MIMGFAAALKLIVLNIATSMRKCSIAATNEKSVAPAQREPMSDRARHMQCGLGDRETVEGFSSKATKHCSAL